MPFQQLVGFFLLVRDLSSYFLKEILIDIDQPKEQIKARFVLKLCLLYLLFTGPMLFHVVNLSRYIFLAVSSFFVLSILTPFLIKYSRSVYLPTKVLLLGAFICIVNVQMTVGNAEGLAPVLWYLVIILSATFVLGLGWGVFYTVFSLGIIAFFNLTEYLEWDILGNSELTGFMRLVMFPFRVILPFSFLVVIAKEFIKSREVAESISTTLLTKQQLLTKQLSESEQSFRELIEEAADMIFRIDSKGQFFYINPTLLKTTGYSRRELLGKSANMLIREEDLQRVKKSFVQQIKDKQEQSYLQFKIITKLGKHIWIGQKTKMIFDKSGNRIQSFCVARNISEQKELNHLLEKAKIEAEYQNEMKTHFMSAVSHELRTPLNAVIALGHGLLEKEVRSTQKEDIQTLLDSADILLRIIKDITSISLMESGKAKVCNTLFRLDKSLHKLLRTYQRLNKNKLVNIELQIDPKVPIQLKGDEVRLLQVLNNLVQNAIKFTESGFVKIIVQPKAITAKSATIYFEVQDTGIGIEPHQIKNIFDRFTQADASLSRSHGGIGVGLTVVKKTLGLLNSEIEVKSEVKKGSSFHFSITFEKVVGPIQVKKEEALPKGLLKGTKVLLVEDNAMNRLVALKFLKKWQVQSVVAGNGQIATELFQEQQFDIILMDLEMPIMNGIDATSHIRKLPTGATIPIIAVTASVTNSMVNSIMSKQFTDILTKPYKPNDLYRKMVQYLKMKSLQS